MSKKEMSESGVVVAAVFFQNVSPPELSRVGGRTELIL